MFLRPDSRFHRLTLQLWCKVFRHANLARVSTRFTADLIGITVNQGD